MKNHTGIAILNRLIQPEKNDFSLATARYLLKLDFREGDHQRMKDLSEKARAGTLTGDEDKELEFYILVGHLVALLQSKARMTLKKDTRRKKHG